MINGGSGNDSIRNGGYYNDNDEPVLVGGGYKVTIDGGAGNDIIRNGVGEYDIESGNTYGGEYASISGGAGNDSIYNEGDYSTVSGGTGNDYMKLSYYVQTYNDEYYESDGEGGYEYKEAKNVLIQYASGDGDDTIFGFNSTDTLHITNGSYQTSVSGSDVIVSVDTGKIILKNAVGENISIKNSKGTTTTKTYSSDVADLFAEDNLSEIVADKFAVAEFENYKSDFKQENLVTFAK